MKVSMIPPLRSAFEKASIENTYKHRLLELFSGSEDKARQAHDEWYRLHQPPIHHWTTFNTIARMESCVHLLPSERKIVSFITEFDHE